MFQGLSYPTGQMDACCGNQGMILLIHDGHESFHRMLSFLLLFRVVDEVEDLLAVLLKKRPFYGQIAGGVIVGDMLTGRANNGIGSFRGFLPGPPAANKKSAAAGADGWFRQLLFLLVSIVAPLLYQSVSSAVLTLVHIR